MKLRPTCTQPLPPAPLGIPTPSGIPLVCSGSALFYAGYSWNSSWGESLVDQPVLSFPHKAKKISQPFESVLKNKLLYWEKKGESILTLKKFPEIKDGFIQSHSYVAGNGAVILQHYYPVCVRNSLVVLFLVLPEGKDLCTLPRAD